MPTIFFSRKWSSHSPVFSPRHLSNTFVSTRPSISTSLIFYFYISLIWNSKSKLLTYKILLALSRSITIQIEEELLTENCVCAFDLVHHGSYQGNSVGFLKEKFGVDTLSSFNLYVITKYFIIWEHDHAIF